MYTDGVRRNNWEVHFINGTNALWVCIKDLVKCDQVSFCYFARVRL